MTMTPLTQAELSLWKCSDPECKTPDCSNIWIHGACHPEGVLLAMYDKGRQVVDLVCAQCGKWVATIAVAPTAVDQTQHERYS